MLRAVARSGRFTLVLSGGSQPPPDEATFPRFDLAVLGRCTDGRTASLFPGTKVLAETQRLVVANWVVKLNTLCITLQSRWDWLNPGLDLWVRGRFPRSFTH